MNKRFFVYTSLISVVLNVVLILFLTQHFLLPNLSQTDEANMPTEITPVQSALPLPQLSPLQPEHKAWVGHFHPTQVQTLSPQSGPTGQALAPEWHMPPGRYKIGQDTYHFREEGLYRILYQGQQHQRLVYKHDLDALMSALAWSSTQGQADNELFDSERNTLLLNRSLKLSCRNLAYWAQSQLNSLGLKARIIESFTLENWDDFANNHTFIEVFSPQSQNWVLYDLALNTRFGSQASPLSFQMLYQQLQKDVFPEFYVLAQDGISSPEHPGAFWLDAVLNHAPLQKKWYIRVMQAPMIYADQQWLYFSEKLSALHSQTENYKQLTETKFWEHMQAPP